MKAWQVGMEFVAFILIGNTLILSGIADMQDQYSWA